MERVASVVRLPPGFRFHPTDEELVVQYLKRKVFSCPLPASIIPDVNLAKFDPWDLPGSAPSRLQFFLLRINVSAILILIAPLAVGEQAGAKRRDTFSV